MFAIASEQGPQNEFSVGMRRDRNAGAGGGAIFRGKFGETERNEELAIRRSDTQKINPDTC
jgi:methyl coenzyme M reductase subunit C